MWIPRTSDVDRGLDGMTYGGKIAAFVESSPHQHGCSDHAGLELASL